MRIFSWNWHKKFMREFCAKIALKLYFMLCTKGDFHMMAMLFAQKIILTDEVTFNDVPTKLKTKVAKILIDECGVPELVPTEFGGTMETSQEAM